MDELGEPVIDDVACVDVDEEEAVEDALRCLSEQLHRTVVVLSVDSTVLKMNAVRGWLQRKAMLGVRDELAAVFQLDPSDPVSLVDNRPFL